MPQLHNYFSAIIVLLLLLTRPLLGEESQVVATNLDGTTVAGKLLSWDESEIVIYSNDGPVTLNKEEILNLDCGRKNSESASATLLLVDHTKLPIQSYRTDSSQAIVSTGLAEEELSIPTDKIQKVVFIPDNQQLSGIWNELEEKRPTGDVLVIHKKNAEVLDYLVGVVGKFSAEQVAFNWDGDEIPVKISKVAAISYYHAQQKEFDPPTCWIKTRSGGALPAQAVNLVEDQLQVTTIGGLNLQIPVKDLTIADYSQGKVVFLSDMKPISQKWTPLISLPGALKEIQNYGLPRYNHSFSGSQLTLAWPQTESDDNTKAHSNATKITQYNKGLAIRSRTELIFNVPKNMRRFVVLAGINPGTADQGSVDLKVYADDQIVWQGEIEGGAPPLEIDEHIESKRQLRILVDYGKNFDYGDQLHLIDARLTK